jgi:hypothetical protein
MQGPTSDGIDQIVALDSEAKWGWNSETQAYGVIDSAFAESPRIVPVAIFDIDDYLSKKPKGAGGVARIVNIFGFFIEGMGDFDEKTGAITLKPKGGKAVVGRLMKISGSKGGTVQLSETASFSRIIVLVR